MKKGVLTLWLAGAFFIILGLIPIVTYFLDLLEAESQKIKQHLPTAPKVDIDGALIIFSFAIGAVFILLALFLGGRNSSGRRRRLGKIGISRIKKKKY